MPANLASSSTSRGLPRPTPRDFVGKARLEARDGWNISEIKIQELFVIYDRDGSGELEQEEFRQLLRDFNDGVMPTEREIAFTMRVADTDHTGTIGVNELHYALRTWYTYRHIDDTVLSLFAEFDLDHSGGINESELRDLLTETNGGQEVPPHEVRFVMDRSHAPGSAGAVNRSELLGAISAWYMNVDRGSTDINALMKEAVVRTARESDHSAVMNDGAGLWGDLAALLRSASGGYLQVNSGDGGQSRFASRDSAGGADTQSTDPLMSGTGEEQTAGGFAAKVMPLLTKACGKICYAGFPFIFGLILVMSGSHLVDNECPRNLDGVLLWFGLLAIALGVLAHVQRTHTCAARARLSLVVLLVCLDLIGLAWVRSAEVGEAKDRCGYFLVYWSMLVWNGITLAAGVYAVYHLGAQMHHLRRHDKKLQQDTSPR